MVRRALVICIVSTTLAGLTGFAVADEGMQPGKIAIMLAAITTTSSTPLTQAQLDLIAGVRSKAADLIRLAGSPVPSGLTAIQASAFTSYNTWLKTKSSQLYALANKWVSNPPTAQTSQTIYWVAVQTTVTIDDPLMIMNIERSNAYSQIVSESNQMVQKYPLVKARHDALLSILMGSSATLTTATILNNLQRTEMQIQQSISK